MRLVDSLLFVVLTAVLPSTAKAETLNNYDLYGSTRTMQGGIYKYEVYKIDRKENKFYTCMVLYNSSPSERITRKGCYLENNTPDLTNMTGYSGPAFAPTAYSNFRELWTVDQKTGLVRLWRGRGLGFLDVPDGPIQ